MEEIHFCSLKFTQKIVQMVWALSFLIPNP